MSVQNNAIDLLLPDFFFVAALSAWGPLTNIIGTRLAAARDGFEPSELLESGQSESEAWPYVLFGPTEDAEFERYALTPTLLDAPYLVRAFMREDIAKQRGEDVEDATGAIATELQKALTSYEVREVLKGGQVIGTAQCELLPTTHRRLYGDAGRRISEMGVNVRLLCS